MTFEQYRKEIHSDEKYAPMSPKEEKRLARLASRGDLAAQTEFVERNLRLVLDISYKLKDKYGLSDDEHLDIIQEGNAKLKDYLQGFQPTFRFSTYCYRGLTRDMRNAINKIRQIRIPVHILDLSRKIYTVSQDYFNEHRAYPSNKELASILEETPEQIKHTIDSLNNTRGFSKDAPIAFDSESTFEDMLEGDNGESVTRDAIRKNMKILLVRYMDKLNQTERKIIIEKYFHGLSDDEIGKKYRLTREKVRQKANLSLRKLRISIEEDKVYSKSKNNFQNFL